jgi:hypothetical protein
MKGRILSIIVSMMLTLGLSACASIPTSPPIAPTVTLKSVKPLKLSLTKQELAFQLEVSNPNSYDQLIFGQILSLNSKNNSDLKYVVKGFVKLANWPLKIPFNTDGKVGNKQLQ